MKVLSPALHHGVGSIRASSGCTVHALRREPRRLMDCGVHGALIGEKSQDSRRMNSNTVKRGRAVWFGSSMDTFNEGNTA